ncbi:MAG: hypothetical protein M5U34_30290 [Chloroflexi bacterium]|nr:hypothetical protein [Chloroflexota bacterium]
MMQNIGQITLEDQPEWLKIVMPIRRNWLLLLLFSAALLVWLLFLGAWCYS